MFFSRLTHLRPRVARDCAFSTARLPRVVILDATDATVEQRALGDTAEVVAAGARDAACRDVSDQMLGSADVLGLWHTVRLDGALLARARRCRLVVRFGVGFDNVDARAAGALGVPVVNVPNYGTEEVADAALSHVLNCYRGTAALAARDAVRGPDAIAAAAAAAVGAGGARRVRGEVLGLVGLGRIGTAVALRAAPFGFRVAFFDPYVADGAEKALGVERVDTLHDLLARADCVSLHCPAAGNEHLLDAAALAALRPHAFVVNTARGELIDERAPC